MYEVEREEFEALVHAAVDNLPDHFRDRIENVSFEVEDWADPSDDSLTSTVRGGTLLGVYRGIPLPQRNTGYNLIPPDVIVIFQAPVPRALPSGPLRSDS